MKVSDLITHSVWLPGEDYSESVKPSVSIIMPTFRRGRSGYFGRAVRSILAQTLADLELIIIDDCSVDGTFDQIQSFMKSDGRVSCIRHEKNIGLPAVSTYEGYLKCRSDIIAFAFDDNEFFADAFEKLLQSLSDMGADMVFGYVEMHVDDPICGKYIVSLGSDPIPISTLESHNFIPNNAVLVRRRVFERVGWYDPHILITRLCDWDLWRRIRERYRIERVNVRVGLEHGPSLDDSLGATHKMDLWAIEEWMRNEARCPLLSLAKFGDYSVTAPLPGASFRVKTTLEEVGWQFRDKFWGIGLGRELATFKPLLIVVPAMDASVTLYFEGLPSDVKPHVRFITMSGWRPDQLMAAGAVIFVRDLLTVLGKGWVDLCRQLRIPHYYFADDNFFEIALEDEHYRDWKLEDAKQWLSSFTGVFLSSNELCDYFKRHGLHKDIALLPPSRTALGERIFGSVSTSTSTSTGNVFKILFLGGPHRLDCFVEVILPAIQKLSCEHSIEVILVGVEDGRVLPRFDGVRFRFVERDLDMKRLLQFLSRIGVDLLIHPAFPHRNGIYKTCNAFICADYLECPVLVSRVPPYDNVSMEVVSVKNEVADWASAVEQIIVSADRTEVLRDVCSQVCRSDFSGQLNVGVLREVLRSAAPVGGVTIESRYSLAWHLAVTKGASMSDRQKLKMALKSIVRKRLRRLVYSSRTLFRVYEALKTSVVVRVVRARLA